MKKISLYILILGAILSSCQSKKTEETIIEEEQETITPVTVTSLATEPMVEYIELNATSAFLQQGFVKASANGYVQSVSYTHLRAHETPEHLVCRLLLEK